MKYLFDYLSPSDAVYSGKVAETVDFVTERQLKDRTLWKKFANQFKIRPDGDNEGWRGEYWGKMMRGGCLIYRYSADSELYDALTFGVEELLKAQDEYGRISTYTIETEFTCWDLWCRKYVLTGLEHFYAICKEEGLKARVISAMTSSADYICERIGDGKTDIRKTSNCWGGVNSCSILEPFLELYKLTGIRRYLSFSEYIVKSGGCIDGNLLSCAEKDGCLPYTYPEVKAYETMSFFEGVLAYYEVTGERYYLDLVKKFVEDTFATERSVIGGIGGKKELFDNFYNNQTEEQPTIVQETCVTVTWIRLLTRLFFNTGDKKYIDRIEKSFVNAMWGSLNLKWNRSYSSIVKRIVSPLPFDSYSPILNDKRGREVAGFQLFPDGTNYGCCACIGSAGVALAPLLAVLKDKDGLILNYYFDGEIKTETPSGKNVNVSVRGNYFTDDVIKIKVRADTQERFTLKIRKPVWSDGACLNGVDYTEKDGYFIVDKLWDNDGFTLEIPKMIMREELNGKTAFTYGPVVLALDEEKGNKDLYGGIVLSCDSGKMQTAMDGEIIRYTIKRENGDELVFTDYASCGKDWEFKNGKICVWIKVSDK